jgi:hypothetical protein
MTVRQVEVEIVPFQVTAKSRRLKGFRMLIERRGKKFCYRVPWTIEPVRDLEAQHGLGDL